MSSNIAKTACNIINYEIDIYLGAKISKLKQERIFRLHGICVCEPLNISNL